MQINIIYDSSVASAPSGYEQAVQAAVSYLDSVLTAPITVNIQFGYGEVNGQAMNANAVGESESQGEYENYTGVRGALAAAATNSTAIAAAASLPDADPTDGGLFIVNLAEAKAIGLAPAAGSSIDGYVGLSSSADFTYDPNNRAVSGAYDAIGVLEHEITEVLGRIAVFGSNTNGTSKFSPLDLFRYSAPGVRDLTDAADYFSINGQTLLTQFNNGANGGDPGDWQNKGTPDSFNASAKLGAVLPVSSTDLSVMDALGLDSIASALASETNDLNGQDKSDVLIQNTLGAVVVGELGSNGQESYVQVGGLGSEWSFEGTGNFFPGAGRSQFLIQNTNGGVVVGEVDNGSVAYTAIGGLGPEWSFHGTGDFLQDGRSQFLIQNTSGSVALGEVDSGSAVYTAIGGLGPEWSFRGAGDFLSDYQSQFLIENTNGRCSWARWTTTRRPIARSAPWARNGASRRPAIS